MISIEIGLKSKFNSHHFLFGLQTIEMLEQTKIWEKINRVKNT